MTFYFAMINAWSLAWEALYGDMDKEYPIIDTGCLLYTSPSPRDPTSSRMPSSA